MNIKLNMCRSVLLALIAACLLQEAHSYCSLEKMKKFAMEACEHLFQQDEASRGKRSVDYKPHHLNRLGFGKLHDKHHYISRGNFPNGGYLKVNREHYHILSELDIIPRYKPRKFHHEKKERERYKRDHSASSYNNIPYCCFNQCDEEFFC
ncbi:uncharacterized protein Dwil_GK20431 [Drosophila willistoni]|uniref:GK20431 n=1 Tax=Drosophila willistoni TaxID=7260 RepID=B4N4W7_DROWI|nr:uncharacterized protein LOC6645916 isoform X2 [Drosophila willistoni]EDW79406.1 uncharacterized protein Dwil_GK20431 [Drosophila willistoni]